MPTVTQLVSGRAGESRQLLSPFQRLLSCSSMTRKASGKDEGKMPEGGEGGEKPGGLRGTGTVLKNH